jgi:hypothetical protein
MIHAYDGAQHGPCHSSSRLVKFSARCCLRTTARRADRRLDLEVDATETLDAAVGLSAFRDA